MSIGKNLRKMRVKKKLSQQEVADRLKIDRITYINWENEISDVKSQYIPKIAEIFDVEIQDLFNSDKKIQITNNIENKDRAGGVGVQKGNVVINIINMNNEESAIKLREQLEKIINKE